MSAMTSPNDILLEIRNLHTHFFTAEGVVKAVNGADLTVRRGRTLCVLGESGCGKSITARSVMQLVDKPGRIVAGEIRYHDANGSVSDIASMDPRGIEIRSYRGRKVALIFQEPMSAFSPVYTVGNQIIEAILLHQNLKRETAKAEAVSLLNKVGIANAEQRLEAFPSQLSGGMLQRAMIAMALCCKPELLIADEPTTALDVTTQAVILDLMRDLQVELGMAMMFITHDLGVVAEIADDVAVMYLGQVVEEGSVDSIFSHPQHPYTRALLASSPNLNDNKSKARLTTIQGMVPHPFARPSGCSFNTRCEQRFSRACIESEPKMHQTGLGQSARCHLLDPSDVSIASLNSAPK